MADVIEVCGICGERIRFMSLVGKWVHAEPDYDPFDSPHAPVVAEWDTHAAPDLPEGTHTT